jgi:hypothetical protein
VSLPTKSIVILNLTEDRESRQYHIGDDEDTAPSDTNIDYKVNSLLYLHYDFWYNSLGSTCTCRYLNVYTNVSERVSSSKLNHRFAGSSIVLHWEDHNLSI